MAPVVDEDDEEAKILLLDLPHLVPRDKRHEDARFEAITGQIVELNRCSESRWFSGCLADGHLLTHSLTHQLCLRGSLIAMINCDHKLSEEFVC